MNDRDVSPDVRGNHDTGSDDLGRQPNESEASDAGLRMLSILFGFALGLASTFILRLLDEGRRVYCLGAAFLSVGLIFCFLLYAKALWAWITGNRRVGRVTFGLALAFVAVGSGIMCWGKCSDYVERRRIVGCVEGLLREVAMQGDLSTYVEAGVLSELPVHLLYDVPLRWRPEYFGATWRQGGKYTVTWWRTRTLPGEVTRAVPAHGVLTFAYVPEQLGMTRVYLRLDKGQWEVVLNMGVARGRDGWRVNGGYAISNALSAIVADMECEHVLRAYRRFYDGVRRNDNDAIRRELTQECLNALTWDAAALPPGKLADMIRARLPGAELPVPSKIKPSYWVRPRVPYWLAVDLQASGFALRDKHCASDGALLYFRASEDRERWLVYVPQSN